MDVMIFHPGTGLNVAVPEESVWHYRGSGWITEAEHQEHLAAEQSAADEAARAARKEAQPGKGQGSSGTAAGRASGDREN